MDRPGDRLLVIGHDGVGHALEQHTVALALPGHDPIAERLTAVADALCGPGDLTDPEKFLPELHLRNLVEHLVVELVHREDPLVGLRLVGDDLVIRLDAVPIAASTRSIVVIVLVSIVTLRRLFLVVVRRLVLCSGEPRKRQTEQEQQDEHAGR